MAKKVASPTSAAPKKSTVTAKSSDKPSIQSIAENRKARHKFEIIDTIECGMMLRGSEVKSLRNGKCSLEEAYGREKNGELWLVNCEIPEYKQASVWNHEPKRPRKLLLRKQEMDRMALKAKERGLTLVPLHLYFNERGIAKCLLGICKGLQLHDKRERLKKQDAQRDIQRAVRRKQ